MSMSFKASPDGTVGEILVNGQVVAKLPVTGNAVIPGLVGTVSQSGGVPTGAVVERGSNANGEYVRFADGTQICTVTQTHAGLAVASGFGGGFVSNGLSWNFPATFVGQPFATFFGRGPIRLMWPMADQPATSGLASYFLASSATQAAADVVIRGTAVGRWF